MNNLPAASLLAAHAPPHPYSLLVGLNVGPNLFVTGSLAWVLWLRAAPGAGAQPDVGTRRRLGLLSVPLGYWRRGRSLCCQGRTDGVLGNRPRPDCCRGLDVAGAVTPLATAERSLQDNATPPAPPAARPPHVVTSAEPWKVPGNWCSSTETPA